MAKKRQKVNKDHRITGGSSKFKLVSQGMENMTYKDMKRRAIALGMPFPEALIASFHELAYWVRTSPNKPDSSLIDKYDLYMDKLLEERGYAKDDPMRSYQLNLGFISEENVDNQKKIVRKRIKGLEKPKKPKKERDGRGLWKGTKKSYTYELTDRGYDFERVVRRVLKKFPDAKEKSIQQWYRQALRSKGIEPELKKRGGKPKDEKGQHKEAI